MPRIKRPGLIPNWRQSWRMATVQLGSLAAIFGALPVDQQAAMLAAVGLGPERVPLMLGLAFVAARLWDQPKTHQS